MKKSIRFWVMLPAFAVLIPLVIILTGFMTVRFSENNEDAVYKNLNNTVKALKDDLTHKERFTKIAALDMAHNEEVVKAVKERDTDALLKVLSPSIGLYYIDYYTVVDSRGVVLARTHDPAAFGDSVYEQQNIADALAKTVSTNYETGESAPLAIRTGAPVYGGDGSVIGAVSAGVRLDTERLVDEFKEFRDADAAVYLGDTRIMTTVMMDGKRVIGTKMMPEVTETVLGQGKEYRGMSRVIGDKFYSVYIPLFDPQGEPLAAFHVGKSYKEVTAAVNGLITVSVIISALGLAAAMFLFFFIAARISRPLKSLTRNLGSIAEGDFDFDLPDSNIREIKSLSGSLKRVITLIVMLKNDLTNITRRLYEKGDMDYRIDTEKYKGAYSEISQGINALAGAFAGDLAAVTDIFTEISKGNFQCEMERMPGKKAALNDACDMLLENLNCLHGEIVTIARAAADGDLSVRADEDEYQMGWAELLRGLNGLVSAIENPLNESVRALEAMAKGEFNKRITGDYKGAFKGIKDAVNSTEEITLSYINEISQVLTSVAEGDLTPVISREYAGQYMPIAKALNKILRSLNKSMREIENASLKVLDSSERIAYSAEYLAEGTAKQASALHDLNAAFDRINEKTRLNASHANNANKIACESNESAKKSSEAMQALVATINAIKESSSRIEGITKAIEEISLQTNMLALNASVESINAGVHGKGFAVVADEVRNLAARSKSAAKEANKILADAIAKAGQSMDEAYKTAHIMDSVVADAQEISDLISQIAHMSQDQTDSIGQVVTDINEISSVVLTNTATSEESATASKNLNTQAIVLKELVSVFKLGNS